MNRTPQKYITNANKTRVISSTITHDPERALREQLHLEIENRTKACANPTYECSLTRIDGFEFCNKHILQNPRSPFKQCSYLYPNGRKCLEPAPKHSTKKDIGTSTYCFEHSRLSQLAKLKATTGKFKAIQTPETILSDLSKYVKLDGYRESYYPGEPMATPAIDVELDTERIVPPKRNILDFASDSESDTEVPTLMNTSRNYELDDSDNESVDSQSDDLLKHAGIYTTEEAAAITKDKLKKLQSLYIEQFQRLYHVLREKRRNYIHALKREKETMSSIYNQPLDTPEERENYAKLKALNHYHKKCGVNAVLRKKLHEKRLKMTDGMEKKQPYYNKCLFTEGGVKCGERAIPAAKHCRKHILEDKKQVLFRACGVEKADIVCQEPVPNVLLNATCMLHMPCPELREYVHKKYQSDTEEDEEIEVKDEIKDEIKEEEEIKTEDMEGITEGVTDEVIETTIVEDEIKSESQIKDETINIAELADINVEDMDVSDEAIVMDDATRNYTEPSFDADCHVIETEEGQSGAVAGEEVVQEEVVE